MFANLRPACFLALLVPVLGNAATWYVSPTGSDAAAGTLSAPFATFGQGQTAASAGDTVYFRGGTYSISTATTTCASQTDNVVAIALSKSGQKGKPIRYWAYPGEKPVFDFFKMAQQCRIKGIQTSGSYIHLKGLEIMRVPQNVNVNHENWGVWNSGSFNTFEQLDIHGISGTGLFIQYGAGNLVLNSDSHDNRDTLTSNGDGQSGDGFGVHPGHAGDTGNVVRGCRAWDNSDDVYDCINSKEAVWIDGCWAWHMGYIPGTTTALAAGNGNGFKLGGYGTDTTALPANPAVHKLTKSLSFANKAAGIYANHHPVSCYFYNNTSFQNHVDIDMLGIDSHGNSTTVGVWRNNVAYGGTLLSDNTHNTADDANNSWTTSGLTLSASSFLSTTYAGSGTEYIAALTAARKSDGSLPDLTLMVPSASSPLIDAGVSVGLPYNGKKPDLGWYETGTATTAVEPSATRSPLRLVPRPGGVDLRIDLPADGALDLEVLDGGGRVLARRTAQATGVYHADLAIEGTGLRLVRVRGEGWLESGSFVAGR